MRQARYRFIVVLTLLLFAGLAVRAQQNSEIVGTVTDQTGAAVQGASLTLTQKETGQSRSTVSNATGGYQFSGLNVGNYDLKATAKGFEAFTRTGLALNVSETLATDIKLTVGAETVEISVSADALTVQTESNDVSTLISGEQLTSIATENRNFTSLAALGLGVSSNLPDSNPPSASASSASISVNGLRQSHNIWLLDGAEADDRGGAGGMSVMPSMDAIAQFQVLASNYPPDYGIASGATFSLALKSGTQKYHGEGWEFFRNDDLDANDFFNKYERSGPSAYTPVPKLRQNIFGANLGGPVLPTAAHKKTFFFYNQEWRRIIQVGGVDNEDTMPNADRPVAGQNLQYVAPAYAGSQKLYVPTVGQVPDPAFDAKLLAAGIPESLRSGNTYALDPNCPKPVNGVQPACGFPYPNQIIPASLFDADGLAYLSPTSSLLPRANALGDKAVTEESTPTTVTEEVVRIDHEISSKWQLLGHFLHDAQATGQEGADLSWNWTTYKTISSVEANPANSAAVKLSGELSPSLLLEASMNYDGNVINIINSSNSLHPSTWQNDNFFTNTGSNQYPGANWGGNGVGGSIATGYGLWHNAAQDYEPRVDLSYTRGKHQMKYGFSYNRYTKNQQLQDDAAGDYGFGQNQTGTGAGGNSGDPFISELIGLSSGYSQPQSLAIRHYVNQTTSGYVNDNWKVSPRLSLQLGLRYDALPHAWERNLDFDNFDPSTYIVDPNSLTDLWSTSNSGTINKTAPGVATPAGFGGSSYYLNGMVHPGQNGTPHGAVTNDYKTWQPRVGFAEDIFGNGKTVLRGGFGTFYERLQGNDSYGLSNNVPFEYIPSASSVYFSAPTCSWESTVTTAGGVGCGSVAALPVFPVGLTSLDTTYKAPGAAMWSLGVQHELKPSIIWVVQYVGNLGWHQNVDIPIDNFPLNTSNALRADTAGPGLPSSLYPAGSNELRTYPGYTGITQETNVTGNTYNGLQTSLRVQNHWGLSGELDYTYSKNIDITDTDLQTVANPWNLKYEKGDSGYDRRQIFGGNYIYSLPIFNKGNSLAHSLLGGWQLAGTFVDETGEPFAASFGGVNDTIGLGGGYTNYANVVNKITYHHKVNDWFDTYANGGTSLAGDPLAPPTPGYSGGSNLGFGTGRKDSFVGPGRVDFTTSLYKSFAITERAHFDFRAESYNTFNHTEFEGLNTSWSNSTGGQYGTATSDWGPRVLQLGSKIVF